MDVINILTSEEVRAQHFVSVTGEVNAAGKYKMPEIANVMDAIMKAGGFAVDGSTESIEVVRKIGGKFYTRFIDAQTARKLELNPDDSIVVHSKYADSPKGYIEVDGEVNNAGSFLLSENLTVSELIKKAGGLKKEAYKDIAHLFRIKDESFNYALTRISLSEAMSGNPESNLVLRDGDKLFVHSVFEFNPKKTISINGAVNVPGKYIYAADMNIKDLIISAGNLKDNAYYDSAEIVRMNIVDGVTKYSVVDVNLNEVMKDRYNVRLQPYDQVYIKEVSGFRDGMLVKITGEVLFPGEYAITKGERISSILKRAGGVTDYAYVNGMKFIRQSVKKIEEENLKEMKIRLESMVTSMSSQQIASSLSAQDIAANESLSKNLENTIKKLDEIEPEGRVVIDAESIDELA
ncbi:MAG: SLBB domain-containing protein, partial [Geovibrio sp.]|nr:SLBB domain-containing protein [Geovibrio sp.]